MLDVADVRDSTYVNAMVTFKAYEVFGILYRKRGGL